ncbi:MAG TPA: glycosyltransferase family 2 protein [Chitinophagaceae bacterium]|nr:glycosyltransferase family 2 protein [Chitinophagaceae bacterium]
MEILFWLCITGLFYCYVGYGLLLFIRNRLKNAFSSLERKNTFELPAVTLVVAAYNEETVLPEKIKNCSEIDYPPHLFNIIFVTDGSTDYSKELIQQHDFITLLHQPERRGKLAALKRAMQNVRTPVVVFSDANSMLNPGCIRAMVRHFSDEKVGGVAGEKKVLTTNRSLIGEAEGLYWKYESFMKQQDADFNTVVGAVGELFSIRTELFHPLDDDLILDDFVFSIHICLSGYKIEYEPKAFASETPSQSLAEEEKRRVRIAAGAYQAVHYLKQHLNIFKYPRLGVQYFSGRLLRWVACPILIILALVTNIGLVIDHQGLIFYYSLVGQSAFYLLALTGWICVVTGRRMGILAVPFYFVFMNLCLVKGFFNYVRGRQTILWERSMREAFE